MPKIGNEWICDKCSKEALYKNGISFYCDEHWWEFLKEPVIIPAKEIQQRNNLFRKQGDK